MKHSFMLLTLLGACIMSYLLSPSLEYEYVIITALIMSLTSVFYALFDKTNKVFHFTKQSEVLKLNSLIFVAFIGISYLLYLTSCQCSFRGLNFWIILNFAPMLAMAIAVAYLISKSNRRLLSVFILFLVIIIDLILHLWMQPQKRISHWYIGFIHGPVYDRLIYFDRYIFYHRIFLTLLGVYIPMRAIANSKGQRAVSRSLGFVAIFFFVLYTGKPSTSNLQSKLDEALPGTKRYKKLLIHHAVNDKNIDRLFKEAKFNYNELEKYLGTPPKVIEAYVYPSRKDKKLWFGGGNTDVTDVYTPSIHITSRSSLPHPTLRHELVHAFSSFYAYHGLGFHPNMALTEGLAEALAPTRRAVDFDTSSGYLIKNKKVAQVEDLFSPLFWKESGSRAYTIAGSLMIYLIKNYDLERVKRLYSGETLEEVFPDKSVDIINDWKKLVVSKYDGSKAELETESIYRSPGVLSDICPHTKSLLRSNYDSFWEKIRQPTNWNKDNYWSWRADLDPNDRYAEYRVIREEVISQLRKNKAPDMQKLAESYQLPANNIEDLELAMLDFDASIKLDMKDRSDAIIIKLKKAADDMELSQSLTRSIWTRYLLKEEKDWLLYLAGLSKIPEDSTSWLKNYLHFRRSRKKSFLDPQFNIEKNLPETFMEQWHLLRASYFSSKMEFVEAANEYKSALKYARDGDRDYLQLKGRLLEFMNQK